MQLSLIILIFPLVLTLQDSHSVTLNAVIVAHVATCCSYCRIILPLKFYPNPSNITLRDIHALFKTALHHFVKKNPLFVFARLSF